MDPAVSQPLKCVGAITLFVEDPRRTEAFYARVFGLKPVFADANSAAFGFENMIVNFLRRDEAHAMIAPAAVARPDAGSSFQLTIWVSNTDAAVAELAKVGVQLLNGPIDRPWGQRTATFTDPDGHVWELAQAIKG